MTTTTAPDLTTWTAWLDGWQVKRKTGNVWKREGGHVYVIFRDRGGAGWRWCIGGRHWSSGSYLTVDDARQAMFVERQRLRADGVQC